jgi:anti-sigma factor RsiW
MSCEEYEAQLGEYVDGTIDAAAASALGAHLAVCERCRTLADDLRAIRAAARTLERHVPPPAAWTRIAEAVQSDRHRATWIAWRPLAVAATVLVATAATWWTLSQRTPIANPVVPTVAHTAAPLQSVEADVQAAENNFEVAIAGLEAIRKEGGSELDPATAEVVQVNLTVIDRAIGESREALKNEPTNELAQQSLFEAFSSKLALLQDTIALINEMRKGNQEGAARIASGLNQ